MGLRKRGGKWHYRLWVGGREISGRTDLDATERNKSKALAEMENHRKLLLEGRTPERKINVVLFDDAAERYIAFIKGEHRDKPNTWRRIQTSLASAKLFFGRTPTAALTPGRMDDYKTWRRNEHKVREVTIRHDLYALSGFFEYALRHHWCSENPVRHVELPSDADAIRINVLSRADEQEYFAKVRSLKLNNLYDVGRLIVQQGVRPEEAMRIRKADVDLVNGTLRIEYGKTKAARRRLYLTPESAAILSVRLHSHGPWIFPSPRRAGEPLERLNYAHDKVLAELSATARVRQYVSDQAESFAALPKQRSLYIWYRDGLALLDKITSAQPAGLRFVIYDLRHTFATRLAEAGVDLATLAAILGHSSLRMVMRYVHPTEQHQRTAMEKAVRFWSGGEQRQKPSVVIERDSTGRLN